MKVKKYLPRVERSLRSGDKGGGVIAFLELPGPLNLLVLLCARI
jgi:hypothetical protein